MSSRRTSANRFRWLASGVTRRAVVLALMAGLLGSLLIATIAYSVESHRHLSALRRDIANIGEASAATLAPSAWAVDTAQVRTQLNSLVYYPQVTRAELRTDSGDLLVAGADLGEADPITMNFPLSYVDAGRTYDLGILTLFKAKHSDVLRILVDNALLFFGYTSIVIAVSLVCAFAYYRIAVQRVLDLSDQLQDVSVADLMQTEEFDTKFTLGKPDEIDDLAASISTIWATAGRALRNLERAATVDALTGIGNRRGLQEYIATACDHAKKEGEDIALLHLDLDRFKQVNDTYGHTVGDQLLTCVANSMIDLVRSDGFVARIGGDEFLIVLKRAAPERMTAEVAQDIIFSLVKPHNIGGHEISIGGSIGIAFSSDADFEPDALLKNADIAMYEAKKAGRNQFSFYAPGSREALERKVALVQDFRSGLERDELEAFYQPQVDDLSGELIGLESLVRWRHPERGLLAPGAFLDLAFENGLSNDISLKMIDETTKALNFWRDMDLRVPHISINLSLNELRDRRFVQLLETRITDAGLTPADIVIEVLETVLFGDDDDPAIVNLQTLSAHGFAIELDDFGTGHASISNLRAFNVDGIKIDRRFLEGLTVDKDNRVILGTLVGLASNLGIRCLAEGVEDEVHRTVLRELGCTRFQGFGIARPMSCEDVTNWLCANYFEADVKTGPGWG